MLLILNFYVEFMHKKFTTKNVDHLGLVAGMFDEIGIGDIIDRACGEQAKNKNLTFGQCVKCMILNGLGFVGRTLYLYSEYFEDKATIHKQIEESVFLNSDRAKFVPHATS